MEKSSTNELVEISINHKRVDVIAVVTLEEASILMNDEAAAAKYAEALLTQQTPEAIPEISQHSAKHIDCLSTREATLLLLALRTQYNDKFNDRKTQKNLLWQKIASDIKSNGYSIPQGREGTEKCRQKFANLQRNYINYVKHMKTTGTEKRNPLPYFDEINAILGNKDKVYPPYVEDSLDTSNEHTNEPIASCSTSSSSDQPSSSSSDVRNKQKKITNRFSASHTSVRPTNNFNKVMDLFKEQHEQLRTDKEKHMKILEDAIKVQNKQRERFLDFLQKTAKRMRRRNSSSSDE